LKRVDVAWKALEDFSTAPYSCGSDFLLMLFRARDNEAGSPLVRRRDSEAGSPLVRRRDN